VLAHCVYCSLRSPATATLLCRVCSALVELVCCCDFAAAAAAAVLLYLLRTLSSCAAHWPHSDASVAAFLLMMILLLLLLLCLQRTGPKEMHVELLPFLEKNTSLFMKVRHERVWAWCKAHQCSSIMHGLNHASGRAGAGAGSSDAGTVGHAAQCQQQQVWRADML
jgi:hypothetical protein